MYTWHIVKYAAFTALQSTLVPYRTFGQILAFFPFNLAAATVVDLGTVEREWHLTIWFAFHQILLG